MVEIVQTRDACLEHLTVTDGDELEIMANLATSGQIDAVLEGRVTKYLGSRFGPDKSKTLLRCSVGWKGRGRDGVEKIGMTPDMMNGFTPRVTDL